MVLHIIRDLHTLNLNRVIEEINNSAESWTLETSLYLSVLEVEFELALLCSSLRSAANTTEILRCFKNQSPNNWGNQCKNAPLAWPARKKEISPFANGAIWDHNHYMHRGLDGFDHSLWRLCANEAPMKTSDVNHNLRCTEYDRKFVTGPTTFSL